MLSPSRRRASLAVTVFLGVACAAGRARADAPTPAPASDGAPGADAATVDEARALFRAGVELARQERWAEAEKVFARADALVPRASTAYNRALSLYRLGRLREMLTELEAFLVRADPTTDAEDRAHAVQLREQARRDLAHVVIDVTPADAAVTVDGAPASGPGARREVAVDPGDHVLVARATAHGEARRALSLHAGETTTVTLALAPLRPPAPPRKAPPPPAPPPPAPEPRPPSLVGPIVVASVGAAALIGAGVTGYMALKIDRDVARACPTDPCTRLDLADDQTRMTRLATTSDVLLGAGVVLVASGVTWALVSEPSEAPGVTAFIGPGSAGVAGRF